MVKADMNRDYYADLDLPPTADIADIKKQYRKLALKWHPDRNVGREEEVRSRFVVIQEAMEVLSDPVQKQKFDANRRRTTRYPTSSGVKGNPWQDVSSKFQPPPRRTGPQTRQQTTTSGASRYSNWAPPPNRSTKENANENAKAWERMRSTSSSGRPPTSSSGSQHSPRRTARAADPQPVPRSAAQRQRAEASFGNTARRTGFAPASPMGDEPSVSSSNYFTTKTHTSIFEVASAAAAAAKMNANASQRSHAPEGVDPLSGQFSDVFLDERQSTPYANHVGEKTNPFDGASLNRARTVRDSFRRFRQSGGASAATPQRPRSASAGESSPSPKEQSGTYGSTHLHPDSAATGTGQRREPETRSAPTSATFVDPHSSSSSVNSAKADAGGPSAPSARNGPSVFAFNISDDTFDETSSAKPQPQPSMQNSADNINTQFTRGENADHYQFNAGGPSEDDSFLAGKRRYRADKSRGRQSPTRNGTPSADAATNPKGEGEPSQAQSGFDADEWTAKLGAHNFAPPQVARTASSPTRRGMKIPKPVKLTAGTAGMVDDEETSSEEKARPAAPTRTSAGPSPMDIDSPPPESATQATGHVRNIPVEPSRKEWRAGDLNGTKAVPQEEGTPKSAKTTQGFKGKAGGSEDSEDFLGPAMFANTEPFAPTASGLASFGDMKSSLPFQSKASAKLPIQKEKTKPLDFPTAPTAPRLPVAFAVSDLTPSPAEWDRYLREFNVYMVHWAEFNGRVTDHFAARRRQVDETRKDGHFNWIGLQGDSGVEEYLKWLEEDRIVRQKWVAACDIHELTLRQFQKHRQRMKQ